MQTWQRNMLAVWPGFFAISAGIQAVLPGLPLYIEESYGIHDRGEIRFWTSVVYGAGPFCAALMGPFWGSLGDSRGRRPMVLRSVLAIAFVNALMPFATSPLGLALLRGVMGVFAGYVAPGIALVVASAPAERQGHLISRIQVALAAGTLVGPLLGAEATRLFGREAVFWLCAALSACAVVPVLLFAREERRPVPEHGVVRRFLHDLVYLRGLVTFQWLLVLLIVMRLGQNMSEPLIALFVRELGPPQWILAGSSDHEHAVDRTTALSLSILAVASILVTPLWGRMSDHAGPLRCLAVASFGLGVVLLATSCVRTIESYLALRAVAAVFMSGVMTLAYAAASKRVPPERRSLAFSLVQSGIQIGLSVGPLLGQAFVPIDREVANDSGVRGLFVVAAVCLLLAGAGMVLLRFLPAEQPVAGVLVPEEKT